MPILGMMSDPAAEPARAPAAGRPLTAGPALIRAGIAVGDLSDRIASELELRPVEARILYILHSKPSNMIGLARELELVKSTMTGVIARMVAAGLVEREPDPRDRRNLVLALTADGAELAETYAGRMRDMVVGLLEPLPRPDQDELGALLTRVLLRAEQPEPADVLPRE